MHRRLAVAFFLLLALGLAAGAARAQSRTRIFDIALGIPIAALPLDEFVDPACGTNGGPPSLPLDSFESFARCPVETATGLRELWFIYDDEWEYIGRAQRDEAQIGRYSANTLYRQPIITSLLIDDAGLVQGYRVVTDPRAPAPLRKEAFLLAGVFKSIFTAAPWTCTDLPRDEREQPIEGVFVKQACAMHSGDRLMTVESHHLHKPGQDLRLNPRANTPTEGDFESRTRLDVYNADAVKDAPCCRAFARP
jgi:hypothetical protein